MADRYLTIVGLLKDKYDAAFEAGDAETANSIVRQMEMLKADKENYILPREKTEEFFRGYKKGAEGYLEGKKELVGAGDSSKYATPDESWWETAGKVTSTALIQPFNVGKNALRRGAYGAIEGYTAPANSEYEKIINGLIGAGASFGLDALGRGANMTLNMGARNPNLKGAVRFAKEEDLPAPFIDDYAGGLPALGGWIADNPMVLGSLRQAERKASLEKFAVKQTKKRKKPEFMAESVSNRMNADLTNSKAMYNKAFDYIGKWRVDPTDFRKSIDGLINDLDKMGDLAPASVMKKLTALKTVRTGDVKHWHQVRSLLREHQSKMANKMTPGRRYINQSVEKLDTMINDAIPEGGGKMLLQAADGHYGRTIPKYYNIGQLTDAIKRNDPDGVVALLAGKGNKSAYNSREVWNSLDKEGKESVKGLVFKNASRNATDGAGKFSPTKYAEYWKEFSNRSGIMFNKTDQNLISGMEKLYGMGGKMEEGGSSWIMSRVFSPFLAGGGAQMFLPESFGLVLGSSAAIMGLTRTSAGNRVLRGIGQAQSTLQELKAMHQLSKVVSRNPDMLRGTGVTAEEWARTVKEFEPLIDKAYEYGDSGKNWLMGEAKGAVSGAATNAQTWLQERASKITQEQEERRSSEEYGGLRL